MQVDINSTDALASKVENVSAAFGKFVESIEAGIAQKRARLDADVETRLARTNPDDRKTLRALLTRDVEQDIAQTRRDAVAASEDDRAERLALLADAERQLEVLESLNKGPQQVLARLHSGDPKKATYLSVLQMGGPGALLTHMKLALATGDRALASAALIVNDNLPRSKRPFSSAEFAEEIVGEEVKKVQQTIASLLNKISTARELDVAFTRGDSSPTSKIERGLRERGLAA